MFFNWVKVPNDAEVMNRRSPDSFEIIITKVVKKRRVRMQINL